MNKTAHCLSGKIEMLEINKLKKENKTWFLLLHDVIRREHVVGKKITLLKFLFPSSLATKIMSIKFFFTSLEFFKEMTSTDEQTPGKIY